MLSLLLVEDDPLLGQGLSLGLQQRDFLVRWETDGEAGLQAMRSDSFDCVLLDLQLPKVGGMRVLQRWRQADNGVPVVIITARDAIEDRISGLDAGADDYVIKPVSIDELAARIRAVYRRKGGQATSLLVHGEISLDPSGMRVTLGGEVVILSGTEFKLLQTLLEHGQRVVTRSYLEQHLQGRGDGVESNAVEVHVHNLRKKFGKSFIKTVRGVGYVLT